MFDNIVLLKWNVCWNKLLILAKVNGTHSSVQFGRKPTYTNSTISQSDFTNFSVTGIRFCWLQCKWLQNHSFFLVLETSALALISWSKVVCIDSIALCEFRLWLSFSSSFSRILLSMSCLIWASSTWSRSTFDSSASIAPSASSKAAWRSFRSTSMARLDFSTSCRALPDSAQLKKQVRSRNQKIQEIKKFGRSKIRAIKNSDCRKYRKFTCRSNRKSRLVNSCILVSSFLEHQGILHRHSSFWKVLLRDIFFPLYGFILRYYVTAWLTWSLRNCQSIP